MDSSLGAESDGKLFRPDEIYRIVGKAVPGRMLLIMPEDLELHIQVTLQKERFGELHVWGRAESPRYWRVVDTTSSQPEPGGNIIRGLAAAARPADQRQLDFWLLAEAQPGQAPKIVAAYAAKDQAELNLMLSLRVDPLVTSRSLKTPAITIDLPAVRPAQQPAMIITSSDLKPDASVVVQPDTMPKQPLVLDPPRRVARPAYQDMPICPYCGGELTLEEMWLCQNCLTVTHRRCRERAGGCINLDCPEAPTRARK